MKNALLLAHYYTTPDVQAMADYVGDSLELAMIAQREKAERIVFAGVKFMAETAKILNPAAEVILPDARSTCSLVTQTDTRLLKCWRERYADHVHVTYINSDVETKTLADWVVTSRNVDDIVAHLISSGRKVIFSPDRNMGAYLNYQYGYDMPLWSAVCEVHDQFNAERIEQMLQAVKSGDAEPLLISHPESPLPVLKQSDFVGSTKQMLQWIAKLEDATRSVFVATEEGLLHNMRQTRPDLDIRQAPIYAGCQCNACPYMKRNTVEKISDAMRGVGLKIDYLDAFQMERARKPIERMLAFDSSQTAGHAA
ncbi:MAG: quinolinate synthase NadA [Gammaproteobacteria bacterium]|nr:quinolinate synthase NadA [Gammaproteobacteria bacterium]